jgi:hypothetical protein
VTYSPCVYAQRWPELWAVLPSDEARRSLSATLASGRLEGMEPDRELVVALVAQARGEVTAEVLVARLVAGASVAAPVEGL